MIECAFDLRQKWCVTSVKSNKIVNWKLNRLQNDVILWHHFEALSETIDPPPHRWRVYGVEDICCDVYVTVWGRSHNMIWSKLKKSKVENLRHLVTSFWRTSDDVTSNQRPSTWKVFRHGTIWRWFHVDSSTIKEVMIKSVFLMFLMTLTLTFDLNSWTSNLLLLWWSSIMSWSFIEICQSTLKKIVPQTNKQTDRQTDRQTNKQKNS